MSVTANLLYILAHVIEDVEPEHKEEIEKAIEVAQIKKVGLNEVRAALYTNNTTKEEEHDEEESETISD